MEDFNILVDDINNLLKQYTEKTGIVVTGKINETVKYVEGKSSKLSSFIQIDNNELYILKKHKIIEDMMSNNYEEIIRNKYKINTKEELIKLYPDKYEKIEEEYWFYVKTKEEAIKYRLEEFKNTIEKCNNYYNKLIELNNGNNIFRYEDLLNILKKENLFIRSETREIYYKGGAITGGNVIEYVLEIVKV